jgi:hypothetical protein
MASPGKGATNVNVIQTDGYAEVVNSISIAVLRRDSNGDILECSGTTVPTDASSGYAKGCIFLKTDVATTFIGRYENVGTSTSSLFVATGLSQTVTSLTATQLKALYGTAVPIVAAPGSGKIISLDEIVWKFTGGVTTYVAGGPIVAYCGSTAGVAMISAITTVNAGLTTVGVTTYVVRKGIDISANLSTLVENTAVVLANSTAPLTTGDGTATVTAYYRVI